MRAFKVVSRIGLVAVVIVALLSIGGDAFGAFPGTNGKIAFASDRDGNVEIYVIDSDGTSIGRITNDPATDSDPTWNADATKIAFTSYRDGNAEIYVMNPDGTGVTRLTNDGGIDSDPAWSPDGTKIAFHTNRDGNDEVYVMNVDGTGQTNLTNDPNPEGSPAWSPDGSKIAFTWAGNLRLMNPDGTGETTITSGAQDSGPDWSPDGSRIAFQRLVGADYEIYVVPGDNSPPVNLSNSPATFDTEPVWSPDGTKIAFARFDSDGRRRIYVMSSSGSGVSALTDGNDNGPSWAVGLPAPPTCHDTANSGGDETGPISGPIHRNVEPLSGPLAPTVHRINCGVIAFQGL